MKTEKQALEDALRSIAIGLEEDQDWQSALRKANEALMCREPVSPFKVDLESILNRSGYTSLDGYEVEGYDTLMGSSEGATLIVNTADREQHKFPPQEVEVNKTGEATAYDEEMVERFFTFSKSVPLTADDFKAQP